MRTVAVYAGSFNPFHVGHLNIVKKAKVLFDGVIVAQGFNPEKSQPSLFMSDVIFKRCTGCDLMSYEGYLHKFLNKIEKEWIDVTTVLVRGLRNATDFAYEENQLKFIREFKPDIKVVYIPCDPEFNHISSSAIRSMNLIEKGSGNRYIYDTEEYYTYQIAKKAE